MTSDCLSGGWVNVTNQHNKEEEEGKEEKNGSEIGLMSDDHQIGGTALVLCLSQLRTLVYFSVICLSHEHVGKNP